MLRSFSPPFWMTTARSRLAGQDVPHLARADYRCPRPSGVLVSPAWIPTDLLPRVVARIMNGRCPGPDQGCLTATFVSFVDGSPTSRRRRGTFVWVAARPGAEAGDACGQSDGDIEVDLEGNG